MPSALRGRTFRRLVSEHRSSRAKKRPGIPRAQLSKEDRTLALFTRKGGIAAAVRIHQKAGTIRMMGTLFSGQDLKLFESIVRTYGSDDFLRVASKIWPLYEHDFPDHDKKHNALLKMQSILKDPKKHPSIFS